MVLKGSPVDTSDLDKTLQLLLGKLKNIELSLGNIMDPQVEHKVQKLDELSQSLSAREDILSEGDLSDTSSELVFRKIVALLKNAGCTDDHIATTINEYFRPYSRLSYCDVDDVTEALGN